MKEQNRKRQVLNIIDEMNSESGGSIFVFNMANFIADVVNGFIPEYGWLKRLVVNGTLPTMYEVTRTVSSKCYNTMTAKSIYDLSPGLRGAAIRCIYAKIYGWSLITREVVADMVGFLKGKSVLEVMGGSGYMASLLADNGVDIRCTDNMSWEYEHLFTDVEKIDAVQAITKYRDSVDLVLMSWPPYADEVDCDVLELAVRYDKPLMVIGEIGGCTGSAKFDDIVYGDGGDGYVVDTSCIKSYVPFDGIHDIVSIITPAPSGR